MAAVLLLAAQAAFYAVFGVFVVAFVGLVVITLRWAVRRDRVGRAEWHRRQGAKNTGATGAASSSADGTARRRPRPPGADPLKKA